MVECWESSKDLFFFIKLQNYYSLNATHSNDDVSHHVHHSRDEEQVKLFNVASPNAFARPGAMMIEPFNAHFAI
jgi:hypothetical protein